MKTAIGLWMVCVSVASFIILVMYDGDLKEKFLIILNTSICVGALIIGIYMMG